MNTGASQRHAQEFAKQLSAIRQRLILADGQIPPEPDSKPLFLRCFGRFEQPDFITEMLAVGHHQPAAIW
jgi:hypothetical protein